MKITEIIEANIEKIKDFGFDAKLSSVSFETSFYIDVFDFKTNECYFTLRFSDHCLNEHNQVPAGVITGEYYLPNNKIISKKNFDYYMDIRKKMNKEEVDELFTNRLVSELYDF